MVTLVLTLLSMLLFASIFGYILVVLKEKSYLKKNIILIDNKHVTQDHLNETDMKEFFLDGTKLKAGDEIKVVTRTKDSFIGTVIGAINKEKAILLVTHSNEIIQCKIENILHFKIISKYGKFFS